MKLSESIALHTPVLKAGGVGSGPQLPAIQREIAQRMANHLKVVTVHTPSQSHFSPTPKLATPGKVGHGGSAPKAPSGGPKVTKSAPRPGGKIGAGGPGSGRHSNGGNPESKPNHAGLHNYLQSKGFTFGGTKYDFDDEETNEQLSEYKHPDHGEVSVGADGSWVHFTDKDLHSGEGVKELKSHFKSKGIR